MALPIKQQLDCRSGQVDSWTSCVCPCDLRLELTMKTLGFLFVTLIPSSWYEPLKAKPREAQSPSTLMPDSHLLAEGRPMHHQPPCAGSPRLKVMRGELKTEGLCCLWGGGSGCSPSGPLTCRPASGHHWHTHGKTRRSFQHQPHPCPAPRVSTKGSKTC